MRGTLESSSLPDLLLLKPLLKQGPGAPKVLFLLQQELPGVMEMSLASGADVPWNLIGMIIPKMSIPSEHVLTHVHQDTQTCSSWQLQGNACPLHGSAPASVFIFTKVFTFPETQNLEYSPALSPCASPDSQKISFKKYQLQ